MNVLITGHTGFVGSNFLSKSHDFKCIGCDLLIHKVSEIDFKGVDTVLHLSALVHQMKGAPEELYFEVNRDLAFNVAKRAKELGVKQFILMSTSKVYGESSSKNSYWDETSTCNPTDPYGKSKLEAERLICDIADENFKVAIIRSPLVYGVGVKANMLNLVKLIDKFPLLPLGGIQNSRSMVYIGNLIALIDNIINQQVSGIFIAGDQSPLTTTRLVQYISCGLEKKRFFFKLPYLIIKLAGVIKPTFVARLFGSLVLDNSNTNKILKFTPPFTSEEGVIEMVKWYKVNLK